MRSFHIPSSLLLGIANVTDIASALIRGIVLARLLSPDQFGLAITISVVASIVELITDLGLTPLAVKMPIKALSTLHSIALIRSLIIGLVIIASGPLFAYAFHSPGTSVAYTIVGIATIIRGCANLELEHRTRHYEFGGKVVALLLAQVAWTGVSLAYAYVYRDYRSMAVGFLSFILTYVAASHVLGHRRWSLAWDRSIASQAWHYGRHLLLNGVATAVSSLGDRVITGSRIGLIPLAHYTALTTSALLPRAALARYFNSVYTPHFINAVGEDLHRHAARVWTITVAGISGIFGIGFLAVGQPVTAIIYGSAYHVDQSLVSLVGILGAIRYLACMPNPPLLASGRNEILARFTALSITGLVAGAVLLTISQKLNWLVLGMCIGEAGALIWLVVRISGLLGFELILLSQILFFPLCILIVDAVFIQTFGASNLLVRFASSCFSLVAFSAGLFWQCRRCACSIQEIINGLIPRSLVRSATVN